MKRLIFPLALSVALVACDDQKQGDTATVGDAVEVTDQVDGNFEVDTTKSYVRFEGFGVGKSHPGRLTITEGNIKVDDGQVTGGKFDIRINSLAMEEEGEMIETRLRPHLLSGDFFDADNHPTATFEITSVEPYTATANDTSVVAGANYRVSGNLQLRDQKKNVSFPAKLLIEQGHVEAVADFNIDRRDWNIVYNNDKSLGDKFISESVNIQLDIHAYEK